MEGVPDLIVRAVAFGEKGAFGEPEQINVFAPGEECAEEPETNLAWIDFANDQSANMVLLNDQDQTTEIYDAIGPVDDPRRAAVAMGTYMNLAITDNYLGLPCNEPVTVKICVEYYDDPFMVGICPPTGKSSSGRVPIRKVKSRGCPSAVKRALSP